MEHPGHKIRTANSVAMLLRRLQQSESAAMPDAMELIGIWDESARVERKWREQIQEGSERRSAGDEEKMRGWYERLIRQIERALRQAEQLPAERSAVEKVLAACRSRKPLVE